MKSQEFPPPFFFFLRQACQVILGLGALLLHKFILEKSAWMLTHGPEQTLHLLTLQCDCHLLATGGMSLYCCSSLAQLVKNPPAMQETLVRFLGQEDPLEKEKATHSSILAWRIP